MDPSYRVLARKYRPQMFKDLVGQDALVTLLQNAIRLKRIPHAVLLTGVRGVGKTTTARILARAVNCVGPDGDREEPSLEPCGVCTHCRDILEDKHLDVLEMDAASRTGVDDIRELIDSVKYRPVRSRFKVYIIDEVHMLSRNAFNALLKTLEEPPPSILFIFATTDAHKIPITVRSRCQRVDLPRVSVSVLFPFLQSIAQKEGVALNESASRLLAYAAEGSVRDSLSLLDQAIALADETGVTEPLVTQMLGLCDVTPLLTLMGHLFSGDVAQALDAFAGLYAKGMDPLMLLEDMLRLTHLLSRAACREAEVMSEQESAFFETFAPRLSVPILTRTWQILLKGQSEISLSPHPERAMEMLIIRLGYVSQVLDVPAVEPSKQEPEKKKVLMTS
jgi:DNA polymerase-3 subunit gamma/tau